jgi:hypothetical protein
LAAFLHRSSLYEYYIHLKGIINVEI